MKTIVKVQNDDGREVNRFEFEGVVMCHQGTSGEVIQSLTAQPASTKQYLLIELERAHFPGHAEICPG